MVKPNEPTGYEDYSSAELHENIGIQVAGAATDDPRYEACYLVDAADMAEELRRRGE